MPEHAKTCALLFDGPGCTCEDVTVPVAAPAAAFRDVVDYIGIAVAAERERAAVMAERMAKEWSERHKGDGGQAAAAFDAGYMSGCVAVAREVRKR